MAIFKIYQCSKCKYKKVNKNNYPTSMPCPKCGKKMPLSNNWYISYLANGKKITEVVGTPKRLAADVLAKRKVEIREGRFFEKKPEVTFPEGRQAFLEWARINRKPHTFRMYENSIKILEKSFGTIDVDKITAGQIEKFKEGRVQSGTANATVNRDLATLKRMASILVQQDKIVSHQTGQVSLLRETPRIRFLTQDECKRLIDACSPAWLKLVVKIALATGLRKSGVFGMKWDDIDFDHKTIKLKVKRDKEVMIPITDQLIHDIQRYRNDEGIVSEFLFPSMKKDIESPIRSDCHVSFRNACLKAGIKDFTFHDLRHTFATHFLRKNAQYGMKAIKALQEILGHSDIGMTMKYAHLMEGDKREAIEALGDYYE